MNRWLLPLVAAVAWLTLTPAASAAIWSWTGTFSSTNPHTGPCIWWHSGQGQACSGWNYWNASAVNNGASGDGLLLVGFQNNSRIRGKYDPESVCCATFQVTPGELGMGGYLIAQWSVGAALAFDALTFAISFLALSLTRRQTFQIASPGDGRQRGKSGRAAERLQKVAAMHGCPGGENYK